MPIFKAEDDYLFFIECINCIKEKHPFIVHSICLMTNHFQWGCGRNPGHE